MNSTSKKMTPDNPAAPALRRAGERLRAARLRRGLTMARVARLAEMNPGTVKSVEGGANLVAATLGRVAAVVGVPFEDLFRR